MALDFDLVVGSIPPGQLRMFRHAAEQLVIYLGVHRGPFPAAGIAQSIGQFLFDFIVLA
jgi:hypothetical protein